LNCDTAISGYPKTKPEQKQVTAVNLLFRDTETSYRVSNSEKGGGDKMNCVPLRFIKYYRAEKGKTREPGCSNIRNVTKRFIIYNMDRKSTSLGKKKTEFSFPVL
jgi:hypothetical protein